jgi:hypothetical protein
MSTIPTIYVTDGTRTIRINESDAPDLAKRGFHPPAPPAPVSPEPPAPPAPVSRKGGKVA